MPQDAIAAAAAANASPPPPNPGPGVDPVKAAADAAMAAGAAPETAAPNTTEPPAVAPAKADDVSALKRSLQQRERTLVQKQQEFATRERQLDESVNAKVERLVQERLGKLKDDPIAFLKGIGIDEPTLATRLVKGNAPQPEELAAKALREAEEVKQQLAAQRRELANREAEASLWAEASTETVYEDLTLEWPTRADVVREAQSIVGQLRARGIDPAQYTMADICKFMNQRAAARAKTRESRKAERAKKAGAQAQTQADGTGAGQGEAPKTASTTTLGKGLGARQSVNGKPGHLMSDKELASAVEAEVARSTRAAV